MPHDSADPAVPGTDPGAAPLLELEVGPVAHGGHCVARVDGRVVFVRHALPGERVRARVTEGGDSAKFWRADAVEVLDASPDRVPSAWPAAGPGGVGGGELAHVSLDGQRRWKAAVLREQLTRLAQDEREVTVEAAPGDDVRGGLGYRTRIDLVADAAGRAGMRAHRSHDVHPLDAMPLATDEVAALAAAEKVFTRRWRPGTRLELVAPSGGAPILLADGVVWRGGPDTRPNARRTVAEHVEVAGHEHRYKVAADGFWQVHREAPALLAGTVLDAVGDVAGARVLDLYAGAGLFTAPLARAVGPDGTVVAVEGDDDAVRQARRNAHGLDQVELHRGAVDAVLGAGEHAARGGADVVVLDPPRVGAGRRVVEQVAALGASRVVYVACDPAALARDVAYLAGHGYGLTSVRAFDLFPHTHHVEAVAVLDR
ncbi:23S rRNA m(5)U-1939 methyltransferase [Sediminihabitans luteus]|uniref:23S rRNA m(5)U-1939 methyltransferase n=1 Tax=Sediminihabitans luteus TaxID=1138585 RepID=A0A2M9CQB1_9CELL|nr:TRAM domain-containing protein [Sediminihabitans luteus]PJJ74094.1 23S rRNA m(5)U-1939 methyltransferase [Sediminihabitans luteus]GII97991.1 23S rRNA methyltransferase [Sediminihabitans luteus]